MPADLRADAPRDDLVRMVSLGTPLLRAESDGSTLFGYAAVFNEDTVIDSWEGKFVERIAPGAFRKTLKDRADQIKVLFNHGMDPQIGDKPLGRASIMREDTTGLYVEVPLSDTSYNVDIRNLLADGALDGMSFRMSVVRDDWMFPEDAELPTRTIREVKLFEFGPVTFPAYSATQAGVRAHAPRAFEAFRSANGLPATIAPTSDEVDDDEPAPAPDATRADTDAPPITGHPSNPTTYTPATPPEDRLSPEERRDRRRAAIERVRRAAA